MLDMSEEELKKFIDIDDYILGYWKLENRWRTGKWLKQKCYVEELIVSVEEYNKLLEKAEDEEERKAIIKKHKFYEKENYYTTMNITVAGLPKKLGKYITFDNFKVGFTIPVSDK